MGLGGMNNGRPSLDNKELTSFAQPHAIPAYALVRDARIFVTRATIGSFGQWLSFLFP